MFFTLTHDPLPHQRLYLVIHEPYFFQDTPFGYLVGEAVLAVGSWHARVVCFDYSDCLLLVKSFSEESLSRLHALDVCATTECLSP